jgi:hypothetical protein
MKTMNNRKTGGGFSFSSIPDLIWHPGAENPSYSPFCQRERREKEAGYRPPYGSTGQISPVWIHIAIFRVIVHSGLKTAALSMNGPPPVKKGD